MSSMYITEETIIKREEEKRERIRKAVANIGKCLDGYTVGEAETILNHVKVDFLERAVVRVSASHGTDTTR